jgi:sulfatase modifying factor 1
MERASSDRQSEVPEMYAAVERAIRFSRKLSYVAVGIAIVGACGLGREETTIGPEIYQGVAASVAPNNAPAGADIPVGAPGDLPASSQQNPDENRDACPSGMVLVEGSWCPEVSQSCVEWKDDPGKSQFARCARYAEPSTCKAQRQPMRFCIDKYESADDSGLPAADVSWTLAAASCQALGKRLCKEREWVFACEGEEMRPYPYGFERNPAVCNFEISEGLSTNKGALADKRQPVTANPDCLSPFGVVNMVGNIDEWVVLDKPHYSQVNGGRRMASGLKGGWWGPLRNRCRPTTVDHDEFFHELQTGYRCCAEPS